MTPDAARLLAAIPAAVLVLRDDLIVLANDAARELLGSDPARRTIADLIPAWPADAGVRGVFEAEVPLAGGVLDVEVRIGGLDTADGAFRVVSLQDARELVAGREAQAAVATAETRFRSLVDQLPAVVYADDGVDLITYVSPQIQDILGVSPEAYGADSEMWRRMIHPDDRETVEAESQAFIDGVGGDLADYRMVRPDGRIVWVRDRANAIRDADGHVIVEHGLLFDVTELKEAEARVAYMAYHDALTGLPNRLLFEETLDLALSRAARAHLGVAVLFLDLDNFKLVNDSLGHHAGDELLVRLAERLKTCTRDTDLVARPGGDEFLMLLADLDPEDASAAAERVAVRVHEVLSDPFDLQGIEFHARASIGISLYPRDAEDASALMKNADVAMYRAKRLEPGGHAFFAGDATEAIARLSFATRLRRAIAEERWVLHYQPIVDLGERA